jgi:peroxiredoxin
MRIFLCLVACAGSLLAAGELSNRRAPGFSLPDSNLKYHDSQDYRGKILLIEIMQTNCTHCAAFAPKLDEIAAKYRGRVAVLSVVNPPDNTATVKRYMSEKKTSVPILFDCGQMAASYLKVGPQNPDVAVPHLFIIDAQGMIRNDYGYNPLTKGIFEGRDLFAELDKMMGKPLGKKR